MSKMGQWVFENTQEEDDCNDNYNYDHREDFRCDDYSSDDANLTNGDCYEN